MKIKWTKGFKQSSSLALVSEVNRYILTKAFFVYQAVKAVFWTLLVKEYNG